MYKTFLTAQKQEDGSVYISISGDVDDLADVIRAIDQHNPAALSHLLRGCSSTLDRKPETNFDKWREGLTVDAFAKILSDCNVCPVGVDKCADEGGNCYDIIVGWADAEVANE